MNEDKILASRAFSDIRAVLTRVSADVIRSIHDAREIHRVLSRVFENQGDEMKNKRSQGGEMKRKRSQSSTPDNNRSKFQRTSQSSSRKTSTFSSQKQSCTDEDDFNSSTRKSSPAILQSPLAPETLPATVRRLIEASGKSSLRITKAVRNQMPEAASTIKAGGKKMFDVRFDEIRVGNSRLRMDQARRTFAQRSLAQAYRQWLLQKCKWDVIDNLMLKPKLRITEGKAEDFPKMYQKNFQDIRTVREELDHGVKMLLLEQRFGKSIISAILNFQHQYLKKVDRNNLEILCTAVREIDWIMELVNTLPNWLEIWQAKYDEVRPPCRPSEQFTASGGSFTNKDPATEGFSSNCHNNIETATDWSLDLEPLPWQGPSEGQILWEQETNTNIAQIPHDPTHECTVERDFQFLDHSTEYERAQENNTNPYAERSDTAPYRTGW